MMAQGEAGVILFQNQGSSEEEGKVDQSPEVSVGLCMVSTRAIWGMLPDSSCMRQGSEAYLQLESSSIDSLISEESVWMCACFCAI